MYVPAACIGAFVYVCMCVCVCGWVGVPMCVRACLGLCVMRKCGVCECAFV